MDANSFKLASSTCDAYSRDSFTSTGWYKCADVLLSSGLSYDESEDILRSKVMRWAGDASNKHWGNYNSADMIRFFGGKDKVYSGSKEIIEQWS